MKPLFIFLTFLFISFSLNGQQVTKWYDYANYDPSCLDGNTFYIDSDSPQFDIEVEFGSSVSGPHSNNKYIERKIIFDITDENGTILNTVTFISLLKEYEKFVLNETHFEGININVPLFINMTVCYTLVQNDENYIHEVTLFHNLEEECSGSLFEVDHGFCCIAYQIICIELCPQMTTDITVLGPNKLKALIVGDPADFSYDWTLTHIPSGQIEEVGGNTQVLTIDPCITGKYSVVITLKGTNCTYNASITFAPPYDCELCLIESPGGIQIQQDIDGMYKFTWEPASGATYYQLIVILNDPYCCSNGYDTQSYVAGTTNTSVTIPLFGKTQCFSYRLVAFCDGQGSASSEKQCFISDGFNDNIIKSREIDENSYVSLYPNPTNATSLLTIDNVKDKTVIVNVYSFEGKLVSNKTITLRAEQSSLQTEVGHDLTSGVYIIQVSSENLNLTKKIFIQE